MENQFQKSIIQKYKPLSKEKEKEHWSKAIFIFDTCSLIDFYFIPLESRKKIYSEIFEKLQERLWIPFHVQYEFLKNREKTIQKPVSSYDVLKKSVSEIGNVIEKKINPQLNNISINSIKKDQHPHIKQDSIKVFQKDVDDFLKKFKSFEKDVNNKIKVEENKINEVIKNDDLLSALENYFKVGREFSYKEVTTIIDEGEKRFRNKIPPGYGDFYKGEKKGTQIFADLIVWKEIINYAKEKQLPVIFISNDNGKDEDWCYYDNDKKRVIAPREELIKEIYDEANVEFWMYNLPQFLFNANKQLKSTIKSDVIKGTEKLVEPSSNKDWDEINKLAKMDDFEGCNIKIKKLFSSNYTLGDIIKLESLKLMNPLIKIPKVVKDLFSEDSNKLSSLTTFNKRHNIYSRLNKTISNGLINFYNID